MNQDFDGIRETLTHYFDGLYHSDTSRLEQAFHADARYVTASGNELVNLGMDEYLPIVAKRPSPASRNEARRDEIVSIEFAGPKTAFVRLHCAIAERLFTDLLTLIRVDEGWRIIAKVFHYDIQTNSNA